MVIIIRSEKRVQRTAIVTPDFDARLVKQMVILVPDVPVLNHSFRHLRLVARCRERYKGK